MGDNQACANPDFLLENYDYFLPPETIAFYPPKIKDECRLLVVERTAKAGTNDEFADASFGELARHLPENALLVANNSKVLPARVLGTRPGGGRLEFLLLTPLPLAVSTAEQIGEWRCADVDCLLRPASKIKIGSKFELAPNLKIEVKDKGQFGRHRVGLCWRGNLEKIFLDSGKLPLPPYIKREVEEADMDDYQTVYAKKTGSVAAPTAGLHFTRALRDRLHALGFGWAEATLYVGYGTFSPVRCADIREHKMHAEYIELPADTAAAINMAKTQGRPIVAVGTTSLRIIEGAHRQLGKLETWSGWTDIFLYPGMKINVADALITNFHLPKSSLLMLVSAFAGRERILNAYKKAIDLGYRFFSYGDAMLIR